MKFIIILYLILAPIQVFGAGMKDGEPIKIFVIDDGFASGHGIPDDAVHLHDTGQYTDGLARNNDTHGTSMMKIYYDKLKDRIESGEVELHSINVADANGGLDSDSVREAISVAKMEGANIVSMSFGVDNVDAMNEQSLHSINELTSDGTIVVKAVGNSGDVMEGDKFISNQSNNYSIISVGALDSTNNNNSIIDYSSGQKTGMVDVYASSVTKNGGTSSATAYTGATIVNEFLNGNISDKYDKDKDGIIDVYEVRSFISSPDISDKNSIIGADKAQYKTLINMGYEYDAENGEFYLPGPDGSKNNTITVLVMHELESDEMIAYKMEGFKGELDGERNQNELIFDNIDLGAALEYDDAESERYNTYGVIGSNVGVFQGDAAMDMDAQYSKKLYQRGLELKANNWLYDKDTGEYAHFIKDENGNWMRSRLVMSAEQAKNDTNIFFNRSLRIGELLEAGYTFDPNSKGFLVGKDGKKYPFSHVDDDAAYKQLLANAGVNVDDSFQNTNSTNDSKIENSSTNNSKTETPSLPITTPTNQQDDPTSQNTQNNTSNTSQNQQINTTEDVEGGLVPCGGTGQSVCTICYMVQGIHNIVKFITGLVSIIGTLVIVVAGVMYTVSSGNPQTTSLAKSAMTSALIGVVVILTAFLLITFIINKVLVADTGALDGVGSQIWNFKCN